MFETSHPDLPTDGSLTIEELTQHVKARMPSDLEVPATIKIWIEGQPTPLYVDGTTAPPRVSNRDAPADCTIRVKAQALRQLINGQLTPLNAYMTGKLKVEGNMALALNLQRIL